MTRTLYRVVSVHCIPYIVEPFLVPTDRVSFTDKVFRYKREKSVTNAAIFAAVIVMYSLSATHLGLVIRYTMELVLPTHRVGLVAIAPNFRAVHTQVAIG